MDFFTGRLTGQHWIRSWKLFPSQSPGLSSFHTCITFLSATTSYFISFFFSLCVPPCERMGTAVISWTRSSWQTQLMPYLPCLTWHQEHSLFSLNVYWPWYRRKDVTKQAGEMSRPVPYKIPGQCRNPVYRASLGLPQDVDGVKEDQMPWGATAMSSHDSPCPVHQELCILSLLSSFSLVWSKFALWSWFPPQPFTPHFSHKLVASVLSCLVQFFAQEENDLEHFWLASHLLKNLPITLLIPSGKNKRQL